MTRGRPSFKLDKQRLRSLRKEKGLSLIELSNAISTHYPNWGRGSSEATLTANYQRIERTGSTSRKTAEAIAKALDVSLAFLEGKEVPDSADYLKQITKLIGEQVAKGDNQALLSALSKLNASSQDEGIDRLSEDISERIEAVQLGRNPTEIAELVAYTRLSESELLTPANLKGHWFITIATRGRNRSDMLNRSDILHGENQIRGHIKEQVKEYFNEEATDGTIRMWRDGFWYRIEIFRPSRRDLMRIDFVRCQPDANGLRWAAQSWRDEYLIAAPLTDWAHSTYNFVSAFETPTSPQKIEQLRLEINEYEGNYAQATGTELVTGHLDEIPIHSMESFAREGSSHYLIVSWLLADLRERLAPKLAAYPVQYWQVSGDHCIDLHLEPPYSDRRTPRGIRYRIRLVEELASGELVAAPWRNADIHLAREKIQSWLAPETS